MREYKLTDIGIYRYLSAPGNHLAVPDATGSLTPG